MEGRAQHTTGSDAPESAVAFGDYVIRAPLARRPAADVFDAEHVPTGAPRLVYVLREPVMQDHPFVHQVVCEVDAARWLRHPSIAKLDGYGDTPSGRMYVAVERPPGRPLGESLARGKPMAPRRLVRLANVLVEALEEAHAVGLVHGRLTPAVVVVADGEDATGSPLLTLTGLGTQAVALDGEVTLAERPYVSPEQLDGRAPDVRSDVFGLASLLHHVLVGSPPPEPGDADVSEVLPEQKSTLDVLAVARSVDPKRRPATVKAFWVDLLAALVEMPAPEAAPPAETPAKLELGMDVSPSAPPLGLFTAVGSAPPAAPLAPRPAIPAAPAFLPAQAAAHPLDTRLPVAQNTPPRPVEPRAPEPPRLERRPEWERAYAADEPEPRRLFRARAIFIYLFWLIVPAAAFAAGWPAGFGGSRPAYVPHHIVVPPPEPREEMQPIRVTKVHPAHAVADSGRTRIVPAGVKPIPLPEIAVPTVQLAQPFSVRAEDFGASIGAPAAKRDSIR